MMKKYMLLIPIIVLLALSLADTAYAQTDTPTPTPTITPTPTATLIYPGNIDSNLASCWPMDEETETRFDVVGSNDLSDTNTVGVVAGKKSNAANFTADNGEGLSKTNPIMDTTIEFTIIGWFRHVDSGTNYQTIFLKGTDVVLSWISGTNITFSYNGTNLAGINNKANTNWQFFSIWFTGSYIYLQIDNGNIYQTAANADTANSTILLFGCYSLPTCSTYKYNGDIDEVVFWNRVLSADERAWMYNYGNGQSCGDIANIPTPTPQPSATPTPGYWSNIPLSSGDYAVLERSIGYGDIAIVIGIVIILVLVGIYILVRINRMITKGGL